MDDRGRVVLATGTSSGIGSAIRRRLAHDGWRVFGSSRSPDGSDPDQLQLDVTSDDSVERAVAQVLQRAGRIDAVVNNAGIDTVGAVEETTTAEAEAIFATNFFGVHRVTRAALPHLRSGGGGHVVVIGSLAGLVPVPFDAAYTAAKHALEGWIDCLDVEVAPFGIRCTVIEPGFVSTGLRQRKRPVALQVPAYAAARRHVENSFDRSVAAGADPQRVADAVADVLGARRPPLRRMVGVDARRITALRALLPSRAFRAGLRRRTWP